MYGKIINVQAPPTGDKDQLNVLFVIFGICLTGILIYAGKKQGKKDLKSSKLNRNIHIKL